MILIHSHYLERTVRNDGAKCCFFVNITSGYFIYSYDFNDELIVKEAEKVLTIVNNCISLGLKWKISILDLNAKIDYVFETFRRNNGIGCFKAIQVSPVLLIYS